MKDIKSLLQNLGLTMADLCGERTRYGCSETSNQTQPHETPAGIHALLPYRSFDPESGFFQNEVGLGGRGSPSVGFVLEVAPMVGATEAMQREISALFQNVLPEGSNLQFLLWADPRIDPLLDAWSNARQGKSFYEALPIMAQKRASFIKRKVFEDVHQSTLFRNFRAIVSYSQDGTLENPVDRQQLLNLKDQIQKAFETLGCPVRLWTAQDAIKTLDGLLNFNESTAPSDLTWNPYDSLESQIPAPGVAYHLDKHHIKIGTPDAQNSYGIKTLGLYQITKPYVF